MYIQKSMNKFQGMSAPAQLSDAPKGKQWEEHQRIKEGEEGFARSSSREAQLERQLKEQQLDELEEELRNKKAEKKKVQVSNVLSDKELKEAREQQYRDAAAHRNKWLIAKERTHKATMRGSHNRSEQEFNDDLNAVKSFLIPGERKNASPGRDLFAGQLFQAQPNMEIKEIWRTEGGGPRVNARF